MAQIVKNPPVMQEIWVPSLGQEDPLERALHPTPVFFPGISYGQKCMVGYSPRGHKKSTQLSNIHIHTHLLSMSQKTYVKLPHI